MLLLLLVLSFVFEGGNRVAAARAASRGVGRGAAVAASVRGGINLLELSVTWRKIKKFRAKSLRLCSGGIHNSFDLF